MCIRDRDAAESAGVEVLLQGELPQESRVVELITAAGAEALTNAVRHADAKQLRMKVSQTDLVCSVVFTNDGRRPEKPLQEGGGLTGLRRRCLLYTSKKPDRIQHTLEK